MTPSLLNRRALSARSSAIRDLLIRARTPGMISFAGGVPDADRFPVDLMAELAASVIGRDGRRALQYGTTVGEIETRSALCALYGPAPDGTPCVDPDDLVVTSGAQQALDLVARVLLEPGDLVACGDPDYLGLLGILHDHDAIPLPLPIDADGLDVDHLERLLRAGSRPRACYLVPHHHNPTGVTLSAERRRHLHHLSARYGFVVIEDDPYRDLHLDDRAPTEIAADPALTVRIRSLSKILSPGLRLGVLAGPRQLTEAIVVQKQSADLHTSTVSQALAVAALDSGFLDRHLIDLRATYRAKLDVLVGALAGTLGERVRFDRPSGGMFVWVRCAGVDTTVWLDRAVDRGACFVPGAAFAVDADLSDRARLSFATASPAEIAEGVDRLAATLPTSAHHLVA